MKDLIKKILKESDEWDWIDDIPQGVVLEPNTVYYYRTLNATPFEFERFVYSLEESSIKNNLIKELLPHVERVGSIKYFVTNPDSTDFSGWCNETDFRDYYLYNEYVDIRETFNIRPISESVEEFGFVNTPELNGVTFKSTDSYDIIYKIDDIGFRGYVTILWENPHTKKMEETAYKRDTVYRLFKQGVWIPIFKGDVI
jgi:hypothetical protein